MGSPDQPSPRVRRKAMTPTCDEIFLDEELVGYISQRGQKLMLRVDLSEAELKEVNRVIPMKGVVPPPPEISERERLLIEAESTRH